MSKKSLNVLYFLFFIALFIQGCAVVRPEVDVSLISSADEASYGKQVNPFVLQHLGALSQDESVQEYLDEVAAMLVFGDQNCTISFVNDPAPGAFVLPGGSIVVTRGLLYHLETEQELIALLAHLVGHDLARHGLQLALSLQPVADHVDNFIPSTAYAAAAVSSNLISASFSEKQEIIADRHAVEILLASGFDPGLLFSIIPDLYARLEELPDFRFGTMVRQHPLSSRRLKSVTAFVETLSSTDSGRQDSDSDTFTKVRTSLSATQPAYDLYQQARKLEKQGVVDQAITLYLQAAVAAPEEVMILTGLGMVYMRQDIIVAARQHLTRATRIDSHYYYPQLGLGYIYLQQEDFTKAAKRLRRSQTLLPTAEGGYLLAQVFDVAGSSQVALTAYREVVRYFNGSQMAKLADKRIVELELLP